MNFRDRTLGSLIPAIARLLARTSVLSGWSATRTQLTRSPSPERWLKADIFRCCRSLSFVAWTAFLHRHVTAWTDGDDHIGKIELPLPNHPWNRTKVLLAPACRAYLPVDRSPPTLAKAGRTGEHISPLSRRWKRHSLSAAG